MNKRKFGKVLSILSCLAFVNSFNGSMLKAMDQVSVQNGGNGNKFVQNGGNDNKVDNRNLNPAYSYKQWVAYFEGYLVKEEKYSSYLKKDLDCAKAWFSGNNDRVNTLSPLQVPKNFSCQEKKKKTLQNLSLSAMAVFSSLMLNDKVTVNSQAEYMNKEKERKKEKEKINSQSIEKQKMMQAKKILNEVSKATKQANGITNHMPIKEQDTLQKEKMIDENKKMLTDVKQKKSELSNKVLPKEEEVSEYHKVKDELSSKIGIEMDANAANVKKSIEEKKKKAEELSKPIDQQVRDLLGEIGKDTGTKINMKNLKVNEQQKLNQLHDRLKNGNCKAKEQFAVQEEIIQHYDKELKGNVDRPNDCIEPFTNPKIYSKSVLKQTGLLDKIKEHPYMAGLASLAVLYGAYKIIDYKLKYNLLEKEAELEGNKAKLAETQLRQNKLEAIKNI